MCLSEFSTVCFTESERTLTTSNVGWLTEQCKFVLVELKGRPRSLARYAHSDSLKQKYPSICSETPRQVSITGQSEHALGVYHNTSIIQYVYSLKHITNFSQTHNNIFKTLVSDTLYLFIQTHYKFQKPAQTQCCTRLKQFTKRKIMEIHQHFFFIHNF